MNGLRHALTPHSHDPADKVDAALESSRAGLRALWISLVVLGVTAAGQAVVVAYSDSVALLGDTLDRPDHHRLRGLRRLPGGAAAA
jgi:Co/Zn/Cd efflux system component